jgi:hypothetical protein
LFCTYRYTGIADAEETAVASNLALQAYFEGRKMTPEMMHQCLEFWRLHVSERTNPVLRKRPVCCEPFVVPLPSCISCYKLVHPKRKIPFASDVITLELKEVSNMIFDIFI